MEYKNQKNRKIIVGYKKVKGVKGYQAVIATDKRFQKNKRTIDTKKTFVKFTRLKRKQMYYVRVRGYQTDSAGKRVYGKFSPVKRVKVMK